jgi:hypothetical protein
MEEAMSRAGAKESTIVSSPGGGKDITYTLDGLVHTYHLRCLAAAVDTALWQRLQAQNCYTVTAGTRGRFSSLSPAPDFMAQMYRNSVVAGGVQSPASFIKRASALCDSCISLINNLMVKFALQHEAPLIAGGYIGGPVPRDIGRARPESDPTRAGTPDPARPATPSSPA